MRVGWLTRAACTARAGGLASTSSMRLSRRSAGTQRSVDPEDVARFSFLSSEWHDENGPFHALHSMNMVRVPWIRKNLPVEKEPGKKGWTGILGGKETTPRVLDVGCGGGILSIALARTGLHVLGVDASEENIEVAKRSLDYWPLKGSDAAARVQFQCTTVEELAEKHPEGAFSSVIASEVVEHVRDVRSFISGLASLALPGAPLFFTTINRTMASKVAAIWIAEGLGIVPAGVHEWEKFVTPSELSAALEANDCHVRAILGLCYNPIGGTWHWANSTDVNYALLAVKNRKSSID